MPNILTQQDRTKLTNLKLEIVNPIYYSGWNKLLIYSQNYSIFHTSNWAKVLRESYGYNPLYFTLFEHGRLLALLPMMEVRSVLTGRRGVSLPFSDYCEPIVLDKTQFQALFTNVISYAKNSRWKSLELRSGRKFFGDIPSSAYFYRHTLDLTRGEEEIFASFQSSTKRNIRKSIRKDVKVEVCNSMNPIKEFYRLNCMTRKNHGIPPQPFSFFKKTYEHIISQNMGIVVLASYENKIIAGAVYFHFGKKAIYKYGASDKTYQNLRPNDLVMWEAIRWYSQNGFDNLCFGKTEPKHEGLRKFKLGWGTKEETLRYFKYDLRQETFVSNSDLVTGAHNKIFSRMPIPMSKILGSVLYKHFG